MPVVERGGTALIRFRMSDLYGETFTYNPSSKQGEVCMRIRTRLIDIEWARVDGMVVKPQKLLPDPLTTPVPRTA